MSGLETAAGNNLDNVLEGRVTSKLANIGLQDSAGSDITNRYERASSGLTHTGDAGLESSAGTDVLRIFARQGSGNFSALTGNAFTNSATTNRRVATGEGSASTSIYLQLNSSGSITVNGLSATAGNWDGGANAVSVAPRNTYQVRFSVSVNSTTGVTITNGATNWSTLSSNRRITLALSSSAVGTWTRTFTVTVEIRRVGFTSPIVSNTFNCSTQLQIQAAWSPSLNNIPSLVSAVLTGPSGPEAFLTVRLESNGTVAVYGPNNTLVSSNMLTLNPAHGVRWDNNDSTVRNNAEMSYSVSSVRQVQGTRGGTASTGLSGFGAPTTARYGRIYSPGLFNEVETTVTVTVRNPNNTSQSASRSFVLRVRTGA